MISLTNEVILVEGQNPRELVRTAINLLGDTWKEFVLNSKKIFVHPNLVTFHKEEACTNVETVRGVIDHISLLTDKEILVGDAGFRNTKKAFENFNYESLKRSGNVKLVDLNDDETIESWAYDYDFNKKPIPFSKTVAESDFHIVVVPAKMHLYYTVSLSLKTAVIGSMVVTKSPFGIYARWPWIHTGYKQAHMTLAEVYTEHPAHLAIIDGTRAMEGDGPADGEVVNLGWVIVSFNPIAADTLASYLMGWNPENDIGYLYYLKKMGWGPTSVDELKIKGGDPEKLRKK